MRCTGPGAATLPPSDAPGWPPRRAGAGSQLDCAQPRGGRKESRWIIPSTSFACSRVRTTMVGSLCRCSSISMFRGRSNDWQGRTSQDKRWPDLPQGSNPSPNTVSVDGTLMPPAQKPPLSRNSPPSDDCGDARDSPMVPDSTNVPPLEVPPPPAIMPFGMANAPPDDCAKATDAMIDASSVAANRFLCPAGVRVHMAWRLSGTGRRSWRAISPQGWSPGYCWWLLLRRPQPRCVPRQCSPPAGCHPGCRSAVHR